jgi:aminoglycoside phosphotransferase (APT) family kinase protein
MPEADAPAGALEEARLLAGPSAAISAVRRLAGGQHADTWVVETVGPSSRVVVRRFPAGDPGPAHEQRVLRAIDGLGGLAPQPLGGDHDGCWSLITWLDGEADITPRDVKTWACELGRALARVHAIHGEALAGLPRVLETGIGRLAGPVEPAVRASWSRLERAPEVLTHSDYWSGNVVWRDGALTGIVDWTGAARGPRAYDLGWCRLDLVLLYDEQIADVFTAAYSAAAGAGDLDVPLCDRWAAARSHEIVDTWGPNYAPLGRADLDASELRRRHTLWTTRLAERS